MSAQPFRLWPERVYPMPHPGPDPRFSEQLVNSVAALLVAYGYPPFASLDDWAALETALAEYLYQPAKGV
ncbi:hypothetical protein [Streptomyces sp. NPDC002746]